MNLAIIPARGGSKRVPRKNVRLFAGRPLIAWPIEIALQSGLFEHVVVSTEDDEIAELAIAAGASVPFRRPSELADDYTATMPVIRHAIRAAETMFNRVDIICCLYPTAAFVQAEDLRAAVELVRDRGRRFVLAIARYPHPIKRALCMRPDGEVAMLWPEYEATRTQDLPDAFFDAGQFYVGTTAAFLSEEPFYAQGPGAVVIPSHRVHDIDTEADFLRAELAFITLKSAGEPNDRSETATQPPPA